MKSFVFRNYSSQFYKPQPVINDDLERTLLTIATPWGSKSGANKSTEIIHNFYLSARGDQEATSPFERMRHLSQEANDLRIAVLFANEKIYNEDNNDEYVTGCELVSMVQVGNEVHFIQVGQPAIYLIRNGISLLPMACHLDMSMNSSTEKNLISPMPSKLIGLEKTIDFSVHTFVPQVRDKIIFLSRTFAPSKIFNMDFSSVNLDSLTIEISRENPNNPFWIGLLEF
ncbi:MAG: hypothetical protein KDD58_02270 [Bdellovibrionales bacterium]|nr:hypothetical protein [Bdellovibrionales bacterium]